MSSKTKSKKDIEPKLRFPEFRRTEGWSVHHGDKLFSPISNKNHNSDLPILAITQEHGAIPRDKINYRVSVTDKSIESYKVVEVGDFIISLRSFQGGIEYSNYKGLCSPAYVILRKKGNQDSGFFKQYFKTDRFIKDLNKDIEGLRDGKMVSYSQFSGLLLPVPPTSDEQQKIANCLSSLDELMETEDKKLEALQQHKKGLMQELFPAEGETLPKLRFPKFKNAPVWQEDRLGNHIEEFRQKSNTQDEYEVLTSSRSGLIRQREYYDNNRITERDNIGFNIVPPNYITYRSRSDDALFFFNLNNLGITGIISVYYPVFRIINGDNAFFTYLFSWYAEAIGKNSVGNAQKVLSLNELRKIVLPIPSSQEQEKIASAISSADDLITSQSQKVASLREHKKGLMQQLFPTVLNESGG
jgi:type I restriction enzyme S subunit